MYGLFIVITIFISLLFIAIYLLVFESKVKLKDRLETYTNNSVKSEYKETEVKISSKKEKITFIGILGRVLPLDKYFQKKKVLLTQARLLIKPEEFFWYLYDRCFYSWFAIFSPIRKYNIWSPRIYCWV